MPKFCVCFECQWIFDNEVLDACPQCESERFDGAREVFGPGAYNLKKSQKPWYDRKMLALGHELRAKIKEDNE